jgi:cobalt/nickel transport system ATP-binding protein
MKAIFIKNLFFHYNSNKEIFNNFNLTIFSQQKVGLIGANGAGKTTLFLCICGILAPNKGTVTLFSKIIKPGKFNPEIGLVFQNPEDQLFCPKVWDDVAFGVENMGLTSAEIDKRVKQSLQITHTLALRDRIPHELSGGEKCMVAIASVLAMNPQVILYDEPSANLDLKARRRLINFLKSSTQTILISSHDLELILEVCDRVILLSQGKIIADDHPVVIMGDPDLMEANNLEIPPSLKK